MSLLGGEVGPDPGAAVGKELAKPQMLPDDVAKEAVAHYPGWQPELVIPYSAEVLARLSPHHLREPLSAAAERRLALVPQRLVGLLLREANARPKHGEVQHRVIRRVIVDLPSPPKPASGPSSVSVLRLGRTWKPYWSYVHWRPCGNPVPLSAFRIAHRAPRAAAGKSSDRRARSAVPSYSSYSWITNTLVTSPIRRPQPVPGPSIIVGLAQPQASCSWILLAATVRVRRAA